MLHPRIEDFTKVRTVHRRLFEAIGDIPPAEAEANHYRTTTPSENMQMAETSHN
jgi:hypothetical protein